MINLYELHKVLKSGYTAINHINGAHLFILKEDTKLNDLIIEEMKKYNVVKILPMQRDFKLKIIVTVNKNRDV